MNRATTSAALAAILATAPLPSLAWGAAGHTLVSRAAAAALPDTLPAFLRTPAAVDEIAALGPELDRSKGAGKTHDADLDPGHYADIGDDGTIFGVALSALPANRAAYDTALRAAGQTQYRAGFLPYELIDGWQQLAKDFAIWRVDRAGEASATDATRARFAADRALRETLTLRDLGVWGHFVGDASQPLHCTVHFNGWGDYANPDGFTTSHSLHSQFEGAFVRAHATLAGVAAKMHPLQASSEPIATIVGRYLTATSAQVVPLYRLEKAGAFASASGDAVDFVDSRLADGASAFRDLIVDAWSASATMPVGYPNPVTPAEVESGAKPAPLETVGGTD